MIPALATVTGQAFANHGSGEFAPGLGGARVSFTPVQLDQTAAVVDALSPVELRTDAQGMIPPTGLWPGEWSFRNHRDLSEFTFVVTAGGTYDLHELRGFVPGPGVTTTLIPLGAVAVTPLPAGSAPTAAVVDGVLTWGIPAGADGADGDPGPAGPAADLAMGTVTTGAPGTPAVASLTPVGDDAYALDLTIPQGDKGDKGDPGDPGPAGSPTAYELRGTGSPLGAITASPGTYYTDTAGTNGAWRWLKKSGTGNTGWECIVGDTGWRDISSLLVGTNFEQSAGSLMIRRINETVSMKLHAAPAGAKYGAATSLWWDVITSIPLGFRLPDVPITDTHIAPAWIYGEPSTLLSIREAHTSKVSIAGSFASKTFGSTTRLQSDLRWASPNAWPTTLPGTPS